jgi:hypothetical protein
VFKFEFLFFFFLSFNLLIGWQLSAWIGCMPFFSLLYNCQLLFLATCFKYCSRGFPIAFYPDIAPSRMFTTNYLCLIIRPIHNWHLFSFFFRPLKNFIIHYSTSPFYFFNILFKHYVSMHFFKFHYFRRICL